MATEWYNMRSKEFYEFLQSKMLSNNESGKSEALKEIMTGETPDERTLPVKEPSLEMNFIKVYVNQDPINVTEINSWIADTNSVRKIRIEVTETDEPLNFFEDGFKR